MGSLAGLSGVMGQTPHPDRFVPEDHPLDAHPPVKVIIVGAGLSGIITAILLSHKVPNLSYTIFDKRDRVGGTWAANIYPGVRCDVPSHCYQATFAPNPNWTEYYSKGDEIRQYYERLVQQYNLQPHIRLQHEVLRADWDASKGVWDVEIRDTQKHGATFRETAPFFINAQGRLSVPKMPSIPGLLTTFAGRVVHTGDWDPALDTDRLAGKRIAIIGNGASGQQILPNLYPGAAHIDHYVRSPVWVTPSFQKNLAEASAANPGVHQYTDDEKRTFARDPEAYLAYRQHIEANLHTKFHRNILGSPENEELRQSCMATMRARVGGSEAWLARLLPDFAPGCKRLTPAPGYLEALMDTAKVEYIQSPLTRATPTGLVTADGTERPVDVVIAATGFASGFVPYFPTVGRHGVDLSRAWAPGGDPGYPESYFGVMAADMPNYFFVLQAQTNGGGGSIPLQVELSATYVAKVLRKMQMQQYRSITPSTAAVREFNAYCQGFFADKVISDDCSSWLKTRDDSGRQTESRNVVWWPGSGHHRIETSFDPRWEDFDYERQPGPAQRNRYAYFGNGWTTREQRGGVEQLASYLKMPDQVDLRRLHEEWFE